MILATVCMCKLKWMYWSVAECVQAAAIRWIGVVHITADPRVFLGVEYDEPCKRLACGWRASHVLSRSGGRFNGTVTTSGGNNTFQCVHSITLIHVIHLRMLRYFSCPDKHGDFILPQDVRVRAIILLARLVAQFPLVGCAAFHSGRASSRCYPSSCQVCFTHNDLSNTSLIRDLCRGFLDRQRVRQTINQQVWNMLENLEEKDGTDARGKCSRAFLHALIDCVLLLQRFTSNCERAIRNQWRSWLLLHQNRAQISLPTAIL